MEPITIYGRRSCGFCMRAVQLCEQKGLGYDYVDMPSQGLDKEDVAEIVGGPVATVPQVLVGNDPIGGYDEFSRYIRDNL